MAHGSTAMTDTEDCECIPLNCGSGSHGHENDISHRINTCMKNNIVNQDEDDGDNDMGCPTNKEFRTGRHIGYCALGIRSSINDSWEIDTITAGGDGKYESANGTDISANSSEDEDENGEFVSFWGHNLAADGSSSASHEYRTVDTTNMRHQVPQHSQSIAKWLFHQKNQAVSDTSHSVSGSFARGKSYQIEENVHDAYLLVASSSTESMHHLASTAHTHCDKKQVHQLETIGIEHEKICSKDKRTMGILTLPMIRPLVRGPLKCFTDSREQNISLDIIDGDLESDSHETDVNFLSLRQDHAAVIESISQGIVGTTDESDANCDDNNPIRNERFLSRVILRFNRSSNRSLIAQLHLLLQKEDWSLATILLQSNPELAQTWHFVDRLYDGRYGSVVLPIHAACALRPPPSFLEMLATLYPKGLMEKDKAFERVPLHVACRGVAESGVIRVLCEMEPLCVGEKDTYKRVPLHYLIKNYFSFGGDGDDGEIKTDEFQNKDIDDDGMTAMKILINANPNCVHAADHRGWLPIHVACSCSSRKGMIRVIRLLLSTWPESVHDKTDKGNDAMDCVAMAGMHHPTKDRVIGLLKEAKEL